MLIESLAQKTRLAMVTVLATIGGCIVICGFTVWCCISLVNKERDQIYILDGDIPFLAQRAQLEANFTMEAKAVTQQSLVSIVTGTFRYLQDNRRLSFNSSLNDCLQLFHVVEVESRDSVSTFDCSSKHIFRVYQT